MTAVWLDGARVTLAPGMLLAQGGEAEVYDLGDGRVVKLWKRADHPDYAGQPDAQAAAIERLAERPAKLRALPGGLPAAVVVPAGLALAAPPAREVVGFVMPKVAGTPLLSYGEPRWRRDHPIAGDELVALLLALYDAVAALHRAGVVVGDFNDLNVLADGARAHLIDVDSYQFAGYRCPMFSERFVDPRLCAGPQLVPTRPHDADSDWFAFALIAFRTLLGVSAWGGVARACPASARALRRLSVLDPSVTYPRAARPLAILPDELLAAFRAFFERDTRGAFPRGLLERLRLRRCTTCGDEHARTRCPTCQTAARVPPAIVHGRLRWQLIDPQLVAFATREVGAHGAIRFSGDALLRETRLGPERIGGILAGRTRAWLGARLGVGFYRAAGYAVGFVFPPERGLLDDRVTLPPIRGELVGAHAICADDRAWLFLTCAEQGRIVTSCVVVGADARVLAAEPLADAPWLAGVPGACAAGPHLFVPTDEGVTRIELDPHGAIAQTRVFAETAPFVSAADRLALTAGGLDCRRARDAIRMQLA